MNGWEWRKASGGWWMKNETPEERIFHAYNETDHAACQPSAMLFKSCEDPHEGSELCRDCLDTVRLVRAGGSERGKP